MAAIRERKVVFVTGGASGIGRRLCELYLARGANVAVFGRTIPDQLRLDLEGKRGPAHCVFHQVDVRDRVGLDSAVAGAVATLGAPDLAVSSAGVQVSKSFATLTGEEFDMLIAINLVGSRNFAASVLPHMKRGSQLALVASLAGLVANYGYAGYSASKFGVIGLAGALRVECKPSGIDVSVVCPPEVETPMVTVERATGDPIALELKKFAGTLGLEQACVEIVRELDAGRWMIIPGSRARLTHRLARFVPGLMNAVSDRMVRRALRMSATS